MDMRTERAAVYTEITTALQGAFMFNDPLHRPSVQSSRDTVSASEQQRHSLVSDLLRQFGTDP